MQCLSSIVHNLEPTAIYNFGSVVASTKETTLIGHISDVVRSGRGPDFVA